MSKATAPIPFAEGKEALPPTSTPGLYAGHGSIGAFTGDEVSIPIADEGMCKASAPLRAVVNGIST